MGVEQALKRRQTATQSNMEKGGTNKGERHNLGE